MNLVYPAVFYPCEVNPGFCVVVPDLPGCVSGGATLSEAIAMGEGFVSLLSLDMDAYAAKYGSKSIRKNLTIPAWLNTFAEQKKLNVSKVLQDALTALYQKEAAAQ